jgi:hypothetical protein
VLFVNLRRGYSIAIFDFLLASCASRSPPPMPTERPGLIARELSEAEKTALAHALSRTLKDPDSAKFQWVPVRYLSGTQITEYCGLINAKNSYGGYIGFETFHAVLQADPNKGQYTAGQIDHIMAANPTGDQLAANVEGWHPGGLRTGIYRSAVRTYSP